MLLLCEDVIEGSPVSRTGIEEQYISTLETSRRLCGPCKAFQQPVGDR